MNLELAKKEIIKIAESPATFSTQEIRQAFEVLSQYDVDTEWLEKYVTPIQKEYCNRGENSSTSLLLRNNAHTGVSGDLYIKAVLQWAASPISTKYIHSDKSAELDCEYVWYDLYIYDGTSSAQLCKKTWLYGNSAWQFVNNGAGYDIIK